MFKRGRVADEDPLGADVGGAACRAGGCVRARSATELGGGKKLVPACV